MPQAAVQGRVYDMDIETRVCRIQAESSKCAKGCVTECVTNTTKPWKYVREGLLGHRYVRGVGSKGSQSRPPDIASAGGRLRESLSIVAKKDEERSWLQ